MNSTLKTLYEPRVLSLRSEVENDHVLSDILADDASPVLVECFLLEWFARTPYLTHPTTRWSKRAAEQLDKLGLDDAARLYREHATLEDARASLVMRDARTVAQFVCMRSGVSIDVAMLTERPTVVMRAYRVLNEEVLGADVPLGYAAIQYEMERITSALCLGLLIQAQRSLGADVAERLTWLRRRAPVGVERAALHAATLEQVLDRDPEVAEQLAEIGAGALDIYRHFLRECVQAARASVRAITGERPSSPRSSRPELMA